MGEEAEKDIIPGHIAVVVAIAVVAVAVAVVAVGLLIERRPTWSSSCIYECLRMPMAVVCSFYSTGL